MARLLTAAEMRVLERQASAGLDTLPSLEILDAIAHLSARRGEPIEVIEAPHAPGAPTAYWVRESTPGLRPACNWLCADSTLDDLSFCLAVWHELGHMHFDDLPSDGAVRDVSLPYATIGRQPGDVEVYLCRDRGDDPAAELRSDVFGALALARAPAASAKELRGLLRSLRVGR